MRTTENGWVIINTTWNNNIYEFTYSRTRTEAIEKWCEIWTRPSTWSGHYKKGFRCVKATRTIELINQSNK